MDKNKNNQNNNVKLKKIFNRKSAHKKYYASNEFLKQFLFNNINYSIKR